MFVHFIYIDRILSWVLTYDVELNYIILFWIFNFLQLLIICFVLLNLSGAPVHCIFKHDAQIPCINSIDDDGEQKTVNSFVLIGEPIEIESYGIAEEIEGFDYVFTQHVGWDLFASFLFHD